MFTTCALALLQAALVAIAFPPLDLWPAALAAPGVLAWLALRGRSTGVVLLAVGLSQLALWLWMERWIVDVTLAGYPMLAAYHSLYPLLLAWLVRRWDAHPSLARWPHAVRLPLLWTAVECLRGSLVFNGYPWFLLAHPLIAVPLAVQSADLFGTYFLGFLFAMPSGLAIDAGRAWRRGALVTRTVLSYAAIVLGLHVLNLVYGTWRVRTSPEETGPRLLVIQTNLPQDNKIGWLPEAQERDLASFIALTREAVTAETPVDLVVWPETMLPGWGLEPGTVQRLRALSMEREAGFADSILSFQRELSVPMLVGSACVIELDVDWTTRRFIWRSYYNSAYLIDGEHAPQRYDKYFLTPFGEVMPYISSWTWLEEKLLAIGAPGMSFALDSSPGLQPLRVRWGEREVVLATPICFEDTVASVCRRLVHQDGRKQVDMLVNLSNDGWFGPHDHVRSRHNQIARFRCIENRVPMVRSVNTGQSVGVDSAGFVISTLGPGRYGEARQAGWMTAELPLDGRGTLYGALGDMWGWIALILAALGTVWCVFTARRSRSEDRTRGAGADQGPE
jgi:apolipoprotein N-acyltransferase